MSTPPYAVHDYRLVSSIGDGNAGKVFTARHVSDRSNSPSSLVAVKVIPRIKVGESARREVDLHFDLNHPNIATLYRVSPATLPHSSSSASHSTSSLSLQSPSFLPPSSPTALALVMEYGSAGDLFSEVASAGVLPPRHFRRRLRHVASALHYLHRRGVVHLDVKLENVVICADGSAKLVDFGCARRLDAPEPIRTTLGGTLHYLAPEVVADQDAPPAQANDAWALGVLAYTALVGNYPFNATKRRASERDEDEETKQRILYSNPHAIPDSLNIPHDLRKIIAGLLRKDPAKRLSISHVLDILDAVPDIPARRYARRIYSTQRALPKAEPGSGGAQRRPRSPSSTPDADFSPNGSTANNNNSNGSDVGGKEGNNGGSRPQTKGEALKVVDRIIRGRMRATTEVNRLFAPIERSAGSSGSHSNSNSHSSSHSQNNSGTNAGRSTGPSRPGAASSHPHARAGSRPRRALSRDSAF